MSYIYNSKDNRFDFPNPYRIENLFYFVASAVLIGGALILLASARGSLGSGSVVATLPLIGGVGLLVLGLRYAARAMSRLRFFFGRGQPRNLAAELKVDQVGESKDAAVLKDLLRHSSLAFPEPTGPINGALYSFIPHLIYAPTRIQRVAQRQFQNALAIAVSLLSLLVSLIGATGSTANWLGLFYFCLALFYLIKPLETGAEGQSSLGFKGLVVLILTAVLGPVAVPLVTHGMQLPNWLPSMGQAGLLMVVTEVAIGLFFLALMRQTVATPPDANMSMVQGTVTMNSHPKQLQDELERCMQERWVASLPNRRYARATPEVSLNERSGSFVGDLLEESQPVPRSELRGLSLATCFSEPRYQWLAWLNTYGIGVMVMAIVSLIAFCTMFYRSGEAPNLGVSAAATLGVALLIVGGFCFRAGGVLWGRFDFVSKLVWVEMKGNFQAAQMDFGNQFTDRIKTQKQVINVESMTLRVWVAELETTAFGKDSPRYILGMRGLKDEADALHAHLTQFGQQQSMVIAPTSNVDLQRAQALGVMNQVGGTPSPAAVALPGAVAQAISQAATSASVAPVARSCPACNAVVESEARFCQECGTGLAVAV